MYKFSFLVKDIVLNTSTSYLKHLLWTADGVGRDSEIQDFPKHQAAMQRKYQLNQQKVAVRRISENLYSALTQVIYVTW